MSIGDVGVELSPLEGYWDRFDNAYRLMVPGSFVSDRLDATGVKEELRLEVNRPSLPSLVPFTIVSVMIVLLSALAMIVFLFCLRFSSWETNWMGLSPINMGWTVFGMAVFAIESAFTTSVLYCKYVRPRYRSSLKQEQFDEAVLQIEDQHVHLQLIDQRCPENTITLDGGGTMDVAINLAKKPRGRMHMQLQVRCEIRRRPLLPSNDDRGDVLVESTLLGPTPVVCFYCNASQFIPKPNSQHGRRLPRVPEGFYRWDQFVRHLGKDERFTEHIERLQPLVDAFRATRLIEEYRQRV